MRKKFLLIPAFVLLMLFSTVAPSMAIGPYESLDKNPNLALSWSGAINNLRGKAGGYIHWVEEDEGGFWMQWRWFDASSGGGKANNAIAATVDTIIQFDDDENAYANGEPTINENKWIFLSPDGSGYQETHPKWGTHGVVWWLAYLSFRAFGMSSAEANAKALSVAAEYPAGVFWQYNFMSFVR